MLPNFEFKIRRIHGKIYERRVYESVQNRANLWLYILKIDRKQNSGGKELVIVCHLGLLHDISRFLNLIIITTQLTLYGPNYFFIVFRDIT